MTGDSIDPAMMGFASLYKQAEGAMVIVTDGARKAGLRIADHVLAVIDTRHRNAWLVARDLGAEASSEGQAWVSLVPRADASRVMRLCGAGTEADVINTEIEDGMMRVLFVAEMKFFCATIPAFPVLPPTGRA